MGNYQYLEAFGGTFEVSQTIRPTDTTYSNDYNNRIHPSMGHMLVRVSGPEPLTLAIFAIGLLGLVSRRSKMNF
ncbi:MAG: hypothetical protein ACJA13_002693 [Paraglaciecola sp.]